MVCQILTYLTVIYSHDKKEIQVGNKLMISNSVSFIIKIQIDYSSFQILMSTNLL